MDCDKLDNGCNGGLPENAYKAIQKIGGLELEDDYKYEGDDETCHFNKVIQVKFLSRILKQIKQNRQIVTKSKA